MASNKGSSGYISVVGTADDNERPLLNGDQGKRSPLCTPSDKVAKRIEIAVLTLVIVLVVALLSLPSVLRFVRKVSTLNICTRITDLCFTRTILMHSRTY